MSVDIRRWWGGCENDRCAISLIVEAHPESPKAGIPDPDSWETWISDCPVCDGPFHWGGGDALASWEDE